MVNCYWGVIKSTADMDKLNAVDVSYSMRLTKTKYVDASKEGGLMRFCSHSCNGTVRSETWIIDGFFVCKLVAKYDLLSGQLISWDYQYQFKRGDVLDRCRCLSHNCRLVLQMPPHFIRDRSDYYRKLQVIRSQVKAEKQIV